MKSKLAAVVDHQTSLNAGTAYVSFTTPQVLAEKHVSRILESNPVIVPSKQLVQTKESGDGYPLATPVQNKPQAASSDSTNQRPMMKSKVAAVGDHQGSSNAGTAPVSFTIPQVLAENYRIL